MPSRDPVKPIEIDVRSMFLFFLVIYLTHNSKTKNKLPKMLSLRTIVRKLSTLELRIYVSLVLTLSIGFFVFFILALVQHREACVVDNVYTVNRVVDNVGVWDVHLRIHATRDVLGEATEIEIRHSTTETDKDRLSKYYAQPLVFHCVVTGLGVIVPATITLFDGYRTSTNYVGYSILLLVVAMAGGYVAIIMLVLINERNNDEPDNESAPQRDTYFMQKTTFLNATELD